MAVRWWPCPPTRSTGWPSCRSWPTPWRGSSRSRNGRGTFPFRCWSPPGRRSATVAGQLDGAAEVLAVRYWPGPLTLVVPREIRFAADLGGPPSAQATVGLRWPDHPLVGRLCRAARPTGRHQCQSARISAIDHGRGGGGGVCRSRRLATILDGGTCDGTPSTVVECRGSATRCIREGAIAWEEIVEARAARVGSRLTRSRRGAGSGRRPSKGAVTPCPLPCGFRGH